MGLRVDLSLVLSTYKRPQILLRTLESFSRMVCAELRWDLWVVDNAGDAATEQLVKDWAGKLPIHYLVEPKAGKNNALNYAIPKVTGQLVVLTDDDVIAATDWLTQFWEGARRWPDNVVFGGRILPDWPQGFAPYDTNRPFMAGAYAVADWDQPEGSIEPKKIYGANMAVRRSVFDAGWRFEGAVGPSQNKNYIMGSETEFLLRLFDAGFRPIYLPKALVYHQIRPEQMSFEWLKKRAYRAGRGDVRSDGQPSDTVTIFGVPRHLIRRTLETYFSYLFARFFDKKNKIEKGMKFYFNLGRLYQHGK